MAGRVPAGRDARRIGPLIAWSASWRHAPVLPALTTELRRRGLCPMALGAGLVLKGGAVHGFGMLEPLTLVALDRSARVVGVGTLEPGGRVVLRGASAVLELPAGGPRPMPGEVVRFTPMLDGCPDV